MRTLAEYREQYARLKGLRVFTPVLRHITQKKDISETHKVVCDVLLLWRVPTLESERGSTDGTPQPDNLALCVVQAFLRILKRVILQGQVLTATNFFALMQQMAEEAPNDEWPQTIEDSIRVLRKELAVPFTQCVASLPCRVAQQAVSAFTHLLRL